MLIGNNQNSYFFYDQLAAESAASEILQEHWDSGDAVEENVDKASAQDSEYRGWTVAQGQGSRALREKVVEVLEKTHSFHGLSLKGLRAAREKNPKLFTIFQSKHLSHAFSFKGPFALQDGSELSLESFHEAFALPMLGSSLLTWASVNPKEQEKAAKIGEILSNALQDSPDEPRIQKALTDFHNGIPILISSGWIWHSTQVLLFSGQTEDENYLIYNNRGADCESGGAISGWNVYKIGEISENLLKKLSSRLSHTKSDYLSCKRLVEEFGAVLIHKESMKIQKAGTCTYTSPKAAIAAMIAIWEITNGFQQKLTDNSFLQLNKSGWKDSYKSFSHYDKELVLRDFLIDLKENSVTTNQALSTLANLIYKKLTDSPIFGFKIGWDLWLEVVGLCECAFPELKSLTPDLQSLVTQFIKEDSKGTINLNNLSALIFHFANKKDDQKIDSCLPTLKNFMSKGKGLQEAEKVVLKLISYEEHKFTILAINLLKALMENGGAYLEQSYSILLKAKKNKELGSICSEFLGIVQMLAMDGKLDIIKDWFQNDPELIVSILEPAFRNLILQPEINKLIGNDRLSPSLSEQHKRLDAIMVLMPFLSNKVYETNATMRSLCNQLIQAERWDEALRLASNLHNTLGNNVVSKYIDFLIKKKLGKEANSNIYAIEDPSIKINCLEDLFNAPTYEHVWEDVTEAILSEISKLEGNKHAYSFALGKFCMSYANSKLWEGAKNAFERIMKIESKYRPSSALSSYSKILSSAGMFDDALKVAESIEGDYQQKASALYALSISLTGANELQKAQEVKLLADKARSVFQMQIFTLYSSK